MLDLSVTCNLFGDEFDPEKLKRLSSLKLSHVSKKGSNTNYKGTQIKNDYGSAIVETIDENKTEDPLGKLLCLLESNLNYLHSCFVNEIDVTLNVGYKGQCNFDLNRKHLMMIVDMNINFSISCYEID